MKLKHWIGLIGITAGLAIAADYTVPLRWTVNGAAFAKNALLCGPMVPGVVAADYAGERWASTTPERTGQEPSSTSSASRRPMRMK